MELVLAWALQALVVSSLLVSVTTNNRVESDELNQTEKKELAKLVTFYQFLEKFPRDYVSDPQELQRRKKIFDKNNLLIARHNVSPEGESFNLHQTAMTDCRIGEYSNTTVSGGDEEQIVRGAFGFFQKKVMSVKHVIPDGPSDSPKDIRTHIDSDLRYCSLNHGEQGRKCGCCYAFAYTCYVEWHYCKQSRGKNINLSEQYIVDCGEAVSGLLGCDGGRISDARTFSNFYGHKLESDYPYKGHKQVCQGLYSKETVAMSDYWVPIRKDSREYWENILKEQPIVVTVFVPPTFTSYDHGIYHGEDCKKNLRHGMVLMGYGDENGEPYWILKENQGQNWGEGGYFRLSRRVPLERCFDSPFIGRFKFPDLSQDDYDAVYEGEFKTIIEVDEEQYGNELKKLHTFGHIFWLLASRNDAPPSLY